MESSGVWVVTSTEARNFLNISEDVHVSRTKEEGEKAFIEIVKGKLKKEKETFEIIASERLGEEPAPGKTLQEIIDLIKRDGESYWYGIENTDNRMVFTGFQYIINRLNEGDKRDIVIQLNYIPFDKTVDISTIGNDDLPSVEELFKEV